MWAMRDLYNLRNIVDDSERLERFYRFMDPTKLVVGGNIKPRWMADQESFWYIEGVPDETTIFRVDGKSGEVAPLFDVQRTRAVLAALVRHELPYNGLPFDSFDELGGDRYRFSFEGTDYELRTNDYTVEALGSGRSISPLISALWRVMGSELKDRALSQSYRRPTWLIEPQLVTEVPSPDKRWFASVKNGNIMLRAPADERSVQLTLDGTPEFAWDIEAPRMMFKAGVHLGERLLDPWSPDGNRLFAVKVDRRGVPELPFVRYLKREEEACSIKIQRAGGPMDIAYPHVIDVLSKRARCLELGNTVDQFFTLVGWLPDGSEVLFTRHSRDFKMVDVLAGNPVDGSVRTVISESASTFVAIQHEVIFQGNNHVTVLTDGSGLIWRSSRSGWNHFYLYTMDGTLICPLTSGEFPVIDLVAVDQRTRWVYFTAHHDQARPYDTHLCRVRLSGGQTQRLTQLDGQNVISISPSNKTFTAVNSRVDRPFRTDFYSVDGRHLAIVQQANASALAMLGKVEPEEFTVTAADGQTQLWGVMYKPADFDSKKKYPVIDHLYGGPQATMVAHHFDLWEEGLIYSRLDRALAQLGYIVILVDGRGTPERSKAFHDVVYGNWGRHEIPDHVATIRELAARYPFMDLDRVGVWGHSWGGYFTMRAMAQAPDFFHVGVASASGTDPYDAIIYEPYLNLPTRAKAAYDYASLYPWAARIRGKLMLITGTSDSVYSNTLEMTHHLIQAGVDHELVVIPEAYHNFYGKDEEYFVHKLVKHFEVHLKSRQHGRPILVNVRSQAAG